MSILSSTILERKEALKNLQNQKMCPMAMCLSTYRQWNMKHSRHPAKDCPVHILGSVGGAHHNNLDLRVGDQPIPQAHELGLHHGSGLMVVGVSWSKERIWKSKLKPSVYVDSIIRFMNKVLKENEENNHRSEFVEIRKNELKSKKSPQKVSKN